MDKMKAAYDEGLAEGHYQADSMYAKGVHKMNKDMGYYDNSDRAVNCGHSEMKAAKRDTQKGPGLKK